MAPYADALEGVIREVVAPAAVEIDRSGAFPTAAIKALGEAGILGLTSAQEVGGGGQGLRAAAEVIERLSGACGSTAMIALMHYAAVPVVEAHGPREVREAIAAGRHLTTLAFSEEGSRSHFWAPQSTAKRVPGGIQLDAHKSWVTSAGQADSYVWSSRPVAAEGPMTLWLVPSDAPGLTRGVDFDGLGLRGNASTPISAQGLVVPESAMVGDDGAGLDLAMAQSYPRF